MWEWLKEPTLTASYGILLIGVALLLVAMVTVALGITCLWMEPARAARALRVMQELRLLVAAMRGKTPSPKDEA